MGRVAAAVLASLLAVGGRAQEFKASVPATKDTPAFSVQLNERPAGQCLGNGFDQEAIIDLQGHDLSRIVVQDNCANEGNGIERLVLYKNGEACECPEYRTFAQNIFLAARTAAWEQNKEHYAQLLIAQLKTAEPSVGKAKIYITSTKYVPEGDVAHLSYVELPEGNAIIFYTYTYVPQGGRARVYIDKPPYGSLDLAAEQTDSSLEKAYRAIRSGQVPLSRPSAAAKNFYDTYFRNVSTGKVPLGDPKNCTDPWICRENPMKKR